MIIKRPKYYFHQHLSIIIFWSEYYAFNKVPKSQLNKEVKFKFGWSCENLYHFETTAL